jgi:hypothetical protein
MWNNLEVNIILRRMYMSNHPDTLVAYVKWFGKITDNVNSAEMAAINSKVSYSLSISRRPDIDGIVQEYDFNLQDQGWNVESGNDPDRASVGWL